MEPTAQDAETGHEPEFEAVFRSSPLGMAVLDEELRFARVNPALCDLLGRDCGWLLGRRLEDITPAGDLPEPRAALEATSGHRVRERYLRPDGSVLHVRVTGVQLPGGDGHRVLLQVEDVTAQHHQEVALHRLATHDALTGLPSRRLLLERLSEMLDEPDRETGRHVAVVFLDLDDFKLVNDALGHAAGDEVLLATARRLEAAVDDGQVVGRLAGDEFLVLSSGVPDLAAALRLVERLDRAVHGPVQVEDDEVLVSASLGVALCTARETTVSELLANADLAMYEAKRRGTRRYEVFDHAMRERARHRRQLGEHLRGPGLAEHLVVHYQPLVALPGGHVVGVEALMRVRRGERLLQPQEFLEVAVEVQALARLEAALFARAAQDVARLRADAGLDLTLSVNVSAAHVAGDLVASVERALAGSGLPPDRLTVELTEQALIDSGASAQATLHDLAATGVRLAIDDFGTGWASLTYLHAFPVSGIKIDRSFVQDLAVPGTRPAETGTALVGALVELARRLSLDVTAEGVESEEQLRSLSDGGRLLGQGFLFGRPVPIAALPALLQAVEHRAPGEPAVAT